MMKNLDIFDNPHIHEYLQDCCLTIMVVVLRIKIVSEIFVTITMVIVMLELALALKFLATMTIVIMKNNNYL